MADGTFVRCRVRVVAAENLRPAILSDRRRGIYCTPITKEHRPRLSTAPSAVRRSDRFVNAPLQFSALLRPLTTTIESTRPLCARLAWGIGVPFCRANFGTAVNAGGDGARQCRCGGRLKRACQWRRCDVEAGMSAGRSSDGR